MCCHLGEVCCLSNNLGEQFYLSNDYSGENGYAYIYRTPILSIDITTEISMEGRGLSVKGCEYIYISTVAEKPQHNRICAISGHGRHLDLLVGKEWISQ